MALQESHEAQTKARRFVENITEEVAAAMIFDAWVVTNYFTDVGSNRE